MRLENFDGGLYDYLDHPWLDFNHLVLNVDPMVLSKYFYSNPIYSFIEYSSPFQEPDPDHLRMPGPHLDDMYN